MIIRGIIFDVNGTLIDILTDEGDESIYRAIGHFLSYQGIYLHRGQVRDMYYADPGQAAPRQHGGAL